MSTKQISRYQVTLQVQDGEDGASTTCQVSAHYWVPEVSARGGGSVELSGSEVDAIKAAAKSAIESKLAEDGSTVEGI
tara:strand:- start:57 stop:290 length:234 start_codon:yes stop_codon:yes gene_type:complete